MANLHLKSGAGASSPYATWANAAVTLATVVVPTVAGDNVYVSPAHAESVAGITVTLPGSTTSITRLLCGTEDASSGITALNTGAVIESSTATFSIAGSFYAHGVTFRGISGSATQLTFASGSGNVEMFNTCKFEITGAHVASGVKFGSISGNISTSATAVNCSFKFGNSAQGILVDYNVVIQGGSLDAAGTALVGLFKLNVSARAARLLCDDFDASAAATTLAVIGTLNSGAGYARIRRMKLPAGWTGAPVATGQLKQGDRIEMIECSAGATLYPLWIMDYAGSIRHEATVKVTAQAESYKMVSTADCSIIAPLKSHSYSVPLSGAAQTVSIPICTDNVTLTDQQIYIEVDRFSTSGSYLGSIVTDAAASIIAAPTDQTTDTTVWTTTGLTTPVRQILSVSVTAGMASNGIVRVVLVRPSTTVFIAGLPTVA